MSNKSRDWEEAARKSPHEKAVGQIFLEKKRFEIIKPLRGDAYIVWPKTGIKVRTATTKEVDNVKQWWAF